MRFDTSLKLKQRQNTLLGRFENGASEDDFEWIDYEIVNCMSNFPLSYGIPLTKKEN